MDSNLIAAIEDQIEILSLRIEKLRKQFDNLDKVVTFLHLIILQRQTLMIGNESWRKLFGTWKGLTRTSRTCSTRSSGRPRCTKSSSTVINKQFITNV